MEKQKRYDWKFVQVGGVTRVRVETGADLAHLEELDQKLWTVLSCPVKGLEIDEKTLEMLDTDHDGKIRVNEVVAASKWLNAVLVKPELLLKQTDTLALESINQKTDEGKRVYDSACQILKYLGLDKKEISLVDTSDSTAIFGKTQFNGDGVITAASTDDAHLQAVIDACVKTIGSTTDRSGAAGVTAEQIEGFYAACADYVAWLDSMPTLPYGDDTEAALAAYNALKDKIADYFMRCKLCAFNTDSTAALDVSVARLEAISDKNLPTCVDEIATYPLARITAQKELALAEGINPAWEQTFADIKRLIFDVDFKKQKAISEADWNSVVAKLSAYIAWKSGKKGEIVEALGADFVRDVLAKNQKDALLKLVEQDKALEAEATGIQNVDKLLHLMRDFYTLVKNFVTMSDFYAHDDKIKAIFQAGTLYIDQRSCELCLKVSDMAKHDAMASASGMYLIYCDCYSKQKNETMKIVAVMTDGDINNLVVGKNAIFYDRNGLDWDATVTKIVDNPISIRQAFWSPYRKFANWVTGLINKSAAEKEAKTFDNITAQVQANATAEKAAEQAKTPAQPFDIAKFAGIFAAFGMAIGALGTCFVSIAKGFSSLTWYQAILAVIAILLVISGPSMILAALKLRKRNLAPLLNANGWAINSNILVNILFGATLTGMAKLPKLNLQDPFVKQGMPAWQKWLISTATIVVIVVVLWLANLFAWAKLPSPLPFFNQAETEVVEEAPVSAEAEALAAE